MTLFQDTGAGPRVDAARYADVLGLYGAIGDAVCANAPGFAGRKAALGASIAKVAQLDRPRQDTVYYAGLLHAIGALGNAAYRKGERLSERLARIESWDVPAAGARRCERLAALPAGTADIVRWENERWDGTGYPDQLRWHGIPRECVVLALADAVARAADPDEALAEVAMQSGRGYGPEMVRTFTMWFHLTGGEGEAIEVPLDALVQPSAAQANALLDDIADAVDEHTGVTGRWRRLAALSRSTAELLGLDAEQMTALGIAVRLAGTGNLADPESGETPFDPLARLGIERHSTHAEAAARLIAENGSLRDAAPVLRARAEWYDGTGKPLGLRHDEIPAAAAILAAAIAYDALEQKDRVDTASGTQFDPRVVRALLEAAKTGSR